MATNLDYLDPALLPLEEKVKAYLETEEEMRKATVDAHSLSGHADTGHEAGGFEQRPATGSLDQSADEMQNKVSNLQGLLHTLRQEIMDLLPARDEWVTVNLGYGPSRVGAFRPEQAEGASTEYILRIVH